MVRPLVRLGLDAFLEAHPELDGLDLGLRVLERLAEGLEVPEDDPIRVPLRPSPRPETMPRLPAPPPWTELWSERSPRPPQAVDATAEPLSALVDAWRFAVVRWLERTTELDLPAVVHRPGAVMCTRTHLDVIFDMEDADLAVRKAALDVDPGWVPWLGRVVQFHYVFGGVLGD